MNFQISVDGANKILQYLSARPYSEAAPLIHILQQGSVVKEAVDVTDEAKVKDEVAAPSL